MFFTFFINLLPVSVPAASLYPFSTEGGDQECIQRMVDFNSPLFKPEIGFPFGKSLRDVLYVSPPPHQACKGCATSLVEKNPKHGNGAKPKFHLNVFGFFFNLKWHVSTVPWRLKVTWARQELPAVLANNELFLISLQIMDRSFSHPRTTMSPPTPTRLPQASVAGRVCRWWPPFGTTQISPRA